MNRAPTGVLGNVGLIVAVASMALSCSQCGDGAEEAPSTPLEVIAPTSSLADVLPPRTAQTASVPKYSAGNFASLTVPNDGGQQEPLTIESLEVEVHVVGRMARTQVTQVFHNHTPRRTEGVYEFTLPQGAAISRLAMDVNGTMVEGEIVEKERARKIYDEIVASMKDPALLEWQGGNRFKTSIFPIEPKSDKKVVLTYEQLLPSTLGESRYRYSMPKLKKDEKATPMKAFSFKLKSERAGQPQVVGYDATKDGETLTVTAKGFVPSGPLDVVFRGANQNKGATFYASRDDEQFFVADVVMDLPAQESGKKRDFVFALDTSASIGSTELERAKKLVTELASTEGARIQIVHGDVKAQSCFNRFAVQSEVADAAPRCLKPLDAAGAANLDALLSAAATAAVEGGRPTSVILLSEGTAAIGELDGELIVAGFLEGVGQSDVTLHAVGIGPTPNEEGLADLASAGGGHYTRLVPVEPVAGTAETVRALAAQPLVRNVKVEVTEGTVQALSASTDDNLARGQSLAVMGKLVSRKATLKVSGTYKGQPVHTNVELTSSSAEGPLVVRNFWARRNIDNLLDEGRDRTEVVGFSKRYGVMSPYTSFLVLENDAAFKKYRIEQKKAAEVKQEAERTGTKNLEKGKDKLQDLLQGLAANEKTKEEFNGDGAADGDDELPEAEEDPAPGERAFEAGLDKDDAPPPPAKAEFKRPADDAKPRPRAAPRRRDAPNKRIALDGKLTKGNMGRFGLGGSGRGGGGAGEGIGLRTLTNKPWVAPPSVKVGQPRILGGVEPMIIKRYIRRQVGAFRNCYRPELEARRAGVGTMVVRFVIDEQGKVTSATILSSPIANAKVETCVVDRIKSLTFPSVGGATTVTYPLVFTPGGFEPKKPNLQAELRQLEARKDELMAVEARRLVRLYLDLDRKEDADTYLGEWTQKADPPGRPAVVRLLTTNKLRSAFETQWLTAIKGEMKANPKEDALALDLFAYLLAQKAYDKIGPSFSMRKTSPPTAGRMLARLVAEAEEQNAKGLFNAWRKNELYSADELDQILTSGGLSGSWRQERYDIAKAMLEAGDDRKSTLERMQTLGLELGQGDDMRTTTLSHCKSKTANVVFCRRWLDEEKNARPQLADVITESRPAWLTRLHEKRAEDVANPDVIQMMSELLEDMGHNEAASRLLSEMVEYRPHDYHRRVRYAQALVAEGQPLDACHTYAVAVQLDPSKRDTFKTMMKLRRDHEKDAEGIKKCIVQGVSNLPVKRDMSIVLTWEDPSADVDLHIHEAGGEEVFYRHRQSAIGGFLYYDIIDGYGPEIYALGDAPKGEYRLTLVYYGGEARDVKAKVTILKNAGSKNEVREVKEIVLPVSNTDKEYPVATISL